MSKRTLRSEIVRLKERVRLLENIKVAKKIPEPTPKSLDFSKLKGLWSCERHEIPENVVCVTAGVDVGQNEIWLVVLGWDIGGMKFVLHSEKIEYKQNDKEFMFALRRAYKISCLYQNKNNGKPKFYGGLISYNESYVETTFNFCRQTAFYPSPIYFAPLKYALQDTFYRFHDMKPIGPEVKGLRIILANQQYLQDMLQVSFHTFEEHRNSIWFAYDAPKELFEHLNNQRVFELKLGDKSVNRWGCVGRNPDNLRTALLNAMLMGRIKNLHGRGEV